MSDRMSELVWLVRLKLCLISGSRWGRESHLRNIFLALQPLVLASILGPSPLSRSLDSRKTPESRTNQTEYHQLPWKACTQCGLLLTTGVFLYLQTPKFYDIKKQKRPTTTGVICMKLQIAIAALVPFGMTSIHVTLGTLLCGHVAKTLPNHLKHVCRL